MHKQDQSWQDLQNQTWTFHKCFALFQLRRSLYCSPCASRLTLFGGVTLSNSLLAPYRHCVGCDCVLGDRSYVFGNICFASLRIQYLLTSFVLSSPPVLPWTYYTTTMHGNNFCMEIDLSDKKALLRVWWIRLARVPRGVQGRGNRCCWNKIDFCWKCMQRIFCWYFICFSPDLEKNVPKLLTRSNNTG